METIWRIIVVKYNAVVQITGVIDISIIKCWTWWWIISGPRQIGLETLSCNAIMYLLNNIYYWTLIFISGHVWKCSSNTSSYYKMGKRVCKNIVCFISSYNLFATPFLEGKYPYYMNIATFRGQLPCVNKVHSKLYTPEFHFHWELILWPPSHVCVADAPLTVINKNIMLLSHGAPSKMWVFL